MGHGGLRRKVYRLLEGQPADHSGRTLTQLAILLLIVSSTVALIVETMPSARDIPGVVFEWIEVATVAVFTVEYLLRAWSCSAAEEYADGIRGRFRYLRTPYALIDVAAILPFYLAMLPIDLRFLRMVRLVRLVRLGKLARYSEAMGLLGRVVVSRRHELGVTLFLGAILLTISAAAIYVVENESQPAHFSSIPAAMWWAVTTLTTVGYGDMAPVTTGGRMIGAVIAILGIGMFALPTGILGASFVEEMRKRGASGKHGRCPTCGRVSSNPDAEKR